MREVELHDTLDRERSALEQDGALHRLGVLNSATSQVKNVRAGSIQQRA
jgi:hypothetical protein